MPFQRPTLTDIIKRDLADLSSRMLGTDGAVLRRSVLGLLARAVAGASHELHGHLDWVSRQVIIDTAEAEYIERWANVWGVRRKSAEFASGAVAFTGSSGSLIPAGTVLRRQDGALFDTTENGTLTSGAATIGVIARIAGEGGNTIAGTSLTLLQPISGVQNSATVTAGAITNGSDVESDEGLRARLLTRIQEPPQGGDADDYVNWALEVPGVTRAWVYPMELGLGTVTVRFVRDDDDSIIPDSTEVDAVQAYIDEKRPVTAMPTVVAPVAVPLDMTIQIDPNSADVQAAVEAEIRDLIRREAEPGGTILISHLREAVSTSIGEIDHVIVTPAGNVTHATGEMAVPGTITWEAIP